MFRPESDSDGFFYHCPEVLFVLCIRAIAKSRDAGRIPQLACVGEAPLPKMDNMIWRDHIDFRERSGFGVWLRKQVLDDIIVIYCEIHPGNSDQMSKIT